MAVSPAEAVEASTVPQASQDPFRPMLDTALEEEEPEVNIDKIVASALEGINLVISMENSLGFPTMRPIFLKLETQGEPPQASTAISPISQGEPSSRVSPMASPAHMSSYMDMLFGSKTPRCSDPPERPQSFRNLEDQLQEVKQLVLDLHGQFASF